jgi:hypothetical protein
MKTVWIYDNGEIFKRFDTESGRGAVEINQSHLSSLCFVIGRSIDSLWRLAEQEHALACALAHSARGLATKQARQSQK